MLNNLVPYIQLRKVQQEDCDLLFQIFLESRPDLTLLQQLPNAETVLFHQFEIDEQQTAINYPNAENYIILYQYEPIGRITVDKSGGDYRLIWLGVRSVYRRQGIGSQLLQSFMKEASHVNKGICLQVAWFNTEAKRLYTKLGFQLLEENQVYSIMHWRDGIEHDLM